MVIYDKHEHCQGHKISQDPVSHSESYNAVLIRDLEWLKATET